MNMYACQKIHWVPRILAHSWNMHPAQCILSERRIEDGAERHLHHPHFDIDERALSIGAAILAETAIRLLNIT